MRKNKSKHNASKSAKSNPNKKCRSQIAQLKQVCHSGSSIL